jgi:hypothetical protein
MVEMLPHMKNLPVGDPSRPCAAEMKTRELPPIHPGEILREEFMRPHDLPQNALATVLRVPPRVINEIG